MPTSHRYFSLVQTSSSSSFKVLASASEVAGTGGMAGSSYGYTKSSPAIPPVPASRSVVEEISAGEAAGLGDAGGADFVYPYEAPPALPNPACSESKKRRNLSIGINIKSCRHNPGRASSWSRDQVTPFGINRLEGNKTASACALVPMRHNRLSVFRRAPPQVPHGV